MQCSCGHICLESYKFKDTTDKGYTGLYWCGFCCTMHMIHKDGYIISGKSKKREILKGGE